MRVRLVLIVALLAILLPPPPAGAVATNDSYWLPGGGVFTVLGHGYGHGHGMSQYGALGAAQRGLTWAQIMAFYYPGTALGTVSGPVRVLVSADVDNTTEVLPVSGLRVKSLTSGASYALSTAGVTAWRMRTVTGATQVERWTNAWTPVVRFAGPGEFSATGLLTLKLAGYNRGYRGTLRFDHDNTVNVATLDEYVKGVVPAEMPASWATEAVRAQAVAARTYATYARDHNASGYYQICDTTSCQVYSGTSREDARSNAAVDATAGRIVTYQGQAAFTQFSSSNGGYSSPGSVPYLVGKADPYDGVAGNAGHSWSVNISISTLESAYPTLGTLQRIGVTSREGGGEWKGWANTVVLDGTRGDVTISGDTFRSKLGLKSRWFAINQTTITKYWTSIGGAGSIVGTQVARERKVTGGLAQTFSKGQIWYGAGISPRALTGEVLNTYLRIGASDSRLGFPTTDTHATSTGPGAGFQHGAIHVINGVGRVTYY